MKNDENSRSSRRHFLLTAATAPIALTMGVSGRNALAATPACGDGATPRQTAGPFFKPDSPQRKTLIDAGMSGENLILSGQVLSRACQPVAGALIDVWHCDDKGIYDNRGYRFRGHQFADADGQFSLDTLTPGLYPGRTRHFHVNVQAPGGRLLTTQLYFPGEAFNEQDFLFDPRLLMKASRKNDRLHAQFDFILNVS